MRKVFVAELEGIGEDLVSMSRAVESAMRDASSALLNCDVTLAEKVIAGDDAIDNMERALDDRCVLVLAQQAPVAGDLRTVVSALRMSSRLERMGDLASHVAALARRAYPEHAIPESLRGEFRQMTDDAQRVSRRITRLLESRDVELAAEIEADDDRLDHVQRETFATMFSEDWDGDINHTVNVTLGGRYLERFGDQAVSIARRMRFLVTGDVSGSE